VEFRPEPPPLGPETAISCVRGCGTTARVAVGGVLVHECPSCRGMWVPEKRLDELVERIVRGAVPASPAATASAAAFEGAARVEYRSCPVCKKQMARRNFHRISGVVIDRCPEHGAWLDADELQRIGAFVGAGGITRAAEKEDLERARQARSAAFRARMNTSTPHHARMELDVSLTRSFAGLVKKLFSGNLRGD
jgi:Zn-finger nucleic acid-binding protein